MSTRNVVWNLVRVNSKFDKTKFLLITYKSLSFFSIQALLVVAISLCTFVNRLPTIYLIRVVNGTPSIDDKVQKVNNVTYGNQQILLIYSFSFFFPCSSYFQTFSTLIDYKNVMSSLNGNGAVSLSHALPH